MITEQDIQNLINAQKQIFVTKGELGLLKEDIKDLITILPTKDDFSDLQSSIE